MATKIGKRKTKEVDFFNECFKYYGTFEDLYNQALTLGLFENIYQLRNKYGNGYSAEKWIPKGLIPEKDISFYKAAAIMEKDKEVYEWFKTFTTTLFNKGISFKNINGEFSEENFMNLINNRTTDEMDKEREMKSKWKLPAIVEKDQDQKKTEETLTEKKNKPKLSMQAAALVIHYSDTVINFYNRDSEAKDFGYDSKTSGLVLERKVKSLRNDNKLKTVNSRVDILEKKMEDFNAAKKYLESNNMSGVVDLERDYQEIQRKRKASTLFKKNNN